MTCPHPDALRAAVTDLRCPLCMEAEIERLRAAHIAEREMIANTAREWAGHYPADSDGRNTFVLFAEWVEQGSNEQQAASRWCIHSSPTLCKCPDCECERRS